MWRGLRRTQEEQTEGAAVVVAKAAPPRCRYTWEKFATCGAVLKLAGRLSTSRTPSRWRIRFPYRRARIIPGVGKMPRRREWHPPPVFLPGRIPWKEKPGGRQSPESQVSAELADTAGEEWRKAQRMPRRLWCLRQSRAVAPYWQRLALWTSLSRVRLAVIPWTMQSVEFSRPGSWSG